MRGRLREAFITTALALCQLASGHAVAQAQEQSPVPPPVTTEAPQAAPTSPLQRDLAEEIDRATTAAGELQSRLDELVTIETRLGEKASAARDRIGALALRLKSAEPGTVAVDRIYDELVAELITARQQLRSALDAWRDPPPINRFTPRLDPKGLFGTPLEEQARELAGLDHRIDELAARLERERAAPLMRVVETDGEVVQRLNNLRIEALQLITAEKRGRLLGLSREGFAQLRREVQQLTLTAGVYFIQRLLLLQRFRTLSSDVFTLSTAALRFVEVLLTIALLVYLRTKSRGMLTALRQFALQRLHSVQWVRRWDALIGLLEVVTPWAILLLGFRLVVWELGDAAGWPELAVVYRLAVLYVSYRLAIDVSFAIIVRVAEAYDLTMDAKRRLLLIRSVRTLIRTVTLLGVLFVLSRQLLGPGFLYNLVAKLSWLVVLVAAVRVLGRWRLIIAEAHLTASPRGWFADLVRRSRDRWYGVFVAGGSFGWLTGRAVAVMAGDFALTFDQTRKALAFLFRRRMEKQAEQRGYAEGRVDLLPKRLVEAFGDGAVADGPLVVERFPGLPDLEQSIAAWRDGRGGGSFVVVGEPGMGKSTWLARADTGEVPTVALRLSRRMLSREEVGKELEPILKDDGERRLAIVDAAQNLFLSRIGGYEALEEFVSIVERTRGRIFWLCAFNAFSWEHLSSVRPDLAAFRGRQILTPWSEEAIRDLITTRSRASGVTFTFEDLVVERMEGVSAQARFLRTEEGYTRLLWDYAGGNPGIALHFWLRSLVPDSAERVRVRLFRAPGTQQLEQTPEEGLFVLAGIVTHENLSVTEVEQVTGYPDRLCVIHLDRLLEMGVLRADEGQYRVTTHWRRAVRRVLGRRNMLPD